MVSRSVQSYGSVLAGPIGFGPVDAVAIQRRLLEEAIQATRKLHVHSLALSVSQKVETSLATVALPYVSPEWFWDFSLLAAFWDIFVLTILNHCSLLSIITETFHTENLSSILSMS